MNGAKSSENNKVHYPIAVNCLVASAEVDISLGK